MESISFFVNFLNLYGQAGIFLLDGLANGIILHLILLVLVPHQIVTVLYRFFYLLLARLREVELHNGIVLELRLSNYVQLSLSLRKDSKSCQIFVCHFKTLQIFDDEIGVLPKLDEKILVGLDAFELPIVALEEKVEVYFSVAGELYLDIFGKLVLVLDHHLHPQHLRLLQCLNRLWLLLDLYDETVLVAVYHLAPLADRWVDYP